MTVKTNHPKMGGVPEKVSVHTTPARNEPMGVDISGAINQLPQRGASGGNPPGPDGGVYPPPGNIINKQ